MKFAKETALIICRCILLFAGAVLILVCAFDVIAVSAIITAPARKLLGLNHGAARHVFLATNIVLLGPSFFLLARVCDFMGDEGRSQRQRRGVGTVYGLMSLGLFWLAWEVSPF